MPAWKVIVVLVFGVLCLALGSATLVFPLTDRVPYHWLWELALFVGTCVVGGVFVLFLRSASRGMK